MKNIFILLVVSTIAFSQNNKEVELPDFVIVGKKKVQLNNQQKPKIQTSIITQSFMNQEVGTDQLKLSELSYPISNDIILEKPSEKFNGKIDIGVGMYSWPDADMSITKEFKHSMLMGELIGLNEREYIKNSGQNKLSAQLGYSYFIPTDYAFLPGSKLLLNTSYERDIYKFFGATDSAVKSKDRNIYNFGIGFGLESRFNENFKFALYGNQHMLYLDNMSDNNYESNFDAKLDMEINFLSLVFNSNTIYKKQGLLHSDSLLFNLNFIKTKLSTKVDFERNMYFELGAMVSKADSEKVHFRPQLAYGINLSNTVWMRLSYEPQQEMNSLLDFLSQNRYINFDNVYNVQTENNKFEFSINYQYYRYFQILSKISYAKVRKMPYFLMPDSAGQFQLSRTNADDIEFRNQLLFHLGPLGMLYGDVNLSFIKNDDGKYLPYYSMLSANIYYKYDINNSFTIEPSMVFRSSAYKDLENKLPKTNNFINFSCKFSYKFSNNVDLFLCGNNLIDYKNYYYDIYREKKIEALAGFTYKW